MIRAESDKNAALFTDTNSFLGKFAYQASRPYLLAVFAKEKADYNKILEFLLQLSRPRQPDEIIKSALAATLLIAHPLVADEGCEKASLRDVLWQVLGRCIRRAERQGMKLAEILLDTPAYSFLTGEGSMEAVVAFLQGDLAKRIGKMLSSPSLLYSDLLIINLMSVFDFFYAYNDALHWLKRPGALQHARFNSPAVNGEIDVKTDYLRHQTASGSQSAFAFCQFPWIWDVERKGELMRATDGLRQRHELQDSFFRTLFDGPQCTHLFLQVRRAHVLEDALRQLDAKPVHNLAKHLRIQFLGEDGVDEGGLVKEFFSLCWRQLFNGDYGLFKEIQVTNGRGCGLFWFNTDHRLRFEHCRDEYRLLGMLLALSIYNGVVVEPRFPLFLCKLLLEWYIDWDAYREIDPVLVSSVSELEKLVKDASPGFVESLGLYFTAGEDELVPNGANVQVTSENIHKYLDMFKSFHFHDSYRKAFEYFAAGFKSVCSPKSSVFYAFRPEEVYLLVFGCDDLNLQQLRSIATYDQGFLSESPCIQWLWIVLMKRFTLADLRAFLAFTTGSDRVPAGGLKRLGSFVISRAGPDCELLPTARTCFNCLLLWEYASLDKLERKLRLAIEHSQGFGIV